MNIHNDFASCIIERNEFSATETDKYIINEFTLLGFELSYSLVNKNLHPEVGQEGLDLRVYLNISWKQ